MKGNNKKMGDFIPPYCHSYIVVANEDQGIENSFPFYVQRRNCGNFQAQYIYIYIYIYTYIYILYVYVYVYGCMYACMYVCMQITELVVAIIVHFVYIPEFTFAFQRQKYKNKLRKNVFRKIFLS